MDCKLLRIEEEVQDALDVAGEAGVVERRGKALGAAAVAHVHADDVAAGAPQFVGIADDVLRVRGAFEAVEDDDGGPRRPLRQRLPVAVAEDLAGDLAAARGRDFDELSDGRGKSVVAAKEVAEDGLQVAVGEEAARLEIGCTKVDRRGRTSAATLR